MPGTDPSILKGSYQAFLVRLWQDSPQSAWRATAKDSLTGHEFHFPNLESLFVFLLNQTTQNQSFERPAE